MGFSYFVFGLTVQSNIPIPGLSHIGIHVRERESRHSVVGVHLNATPNSGRENYGDNGEPIYTSSYLAPSGEPALRIWNASGGEVLYLSYFDGMEFWVDREGKNIWARWPENLSVEDATTYLLGPVLGLVLRLRGATCLHASAVAIEGHAVAFVGATGAGKSTTAAALGRQGLPVLSDDIVALSESGDEFEVLPAYPYLSLWPEPVSTLYGSADAAPRFVPGWEKRCVSAGNHGLKFEEHPLQLGAVYILGPRQDVNAPRIRAITAETAFLSLVTNTYATNILNSEMRAQEFRALSRVIDRIPIRQLLPSHDLERLNDLCLLICNDFASTETRAAANA